MLRVDILDAIFTLSSLPGHLQIPITTSDHYEYALLFLLSAQLGSHLFLKGHDRV